MSAIIPDFLKKDIFPDKRLFCFSCGIHAFLNNPAPLKTCCADAEGINVFSCATTHEDGSITVTLNSVTCTLRPHSEEEKDFVIKFRSYLQASNDSSTFEERVKMLKALKELHCKTFFEE
jgi:hypothetical protein